MSPLRSALSALALALALTAHLPRASAQQPPANVQRDAQPPAPPPAQPPVQPNAQDASPLTLPTLLATVDRTYPLLAAAEQDRALAQAVELETDGAFDTSWRSRATLTPLGYYRNLRLESVVEQPTELWGSRFFAGWRLGDGKFAVYDGKLETNKYGEARVGAFVPILRGGPIDSRRLANRNAALGRDVAGASFEEKRLDYARSAAARYWSWVAAGKRRELAKSLLALAVTRDAALQARVERGDLSPIERLDNSRTIMQREAQVVAADRALTQTSIALSLFLRTDSGDPQVPSPQRLPASFPEPSTIDENPQDTARRALTQRPEIKRLGAQRRMLDNELEQARNQRLPALDFQISASRDFGPGSETRSPTEVEASLMLDVPLQARVQRGKIDQADAKIAKIEHERRFVYDRIKAEVDDTRNAVDMARRRVDVARRELALARELERAERERFDLGDSTLLIVNLRELATFDAALREVDALEAFHVALASFKAASADLVR